MQPREALVGAHLALLVAEVVARHRRLHIPEPRERRFGLHGGDPSESAGTRAWRIAAAAAAAALATALATKPTFATAPTLATKLERGRIPPFPVRVI